MHLKFNLPKYFSFHLRREVKELYAAAAIADLAIAAMLIFEPIFLYETIGFSLVDILLFFATVYGLYFLLIPFGGKFATKFGFKHGMLVSIPFQLLYWGALYLATFNPLWVWVAALLYALEKTFYWPAFHSVVARFANRGQVGREFSMLSAIIQVMHILGPLLGGVIVFVGGSGWLLAAAAIVYVFTIIPLAMHKESGYRRQYEWKDTLKFYRKHPDKMLGYFGFGEELLVFSIWPVFIFTIVKNYIGTGWIATLASAVSVVLSLYLGKLTDGHPKRPLLKMGAVMSALAWLMRPFLPGANGAFSSDTVSRVARNATFIPAATITYERAEVEGIVAYNIFFEQSLALGKMLTAFLAAGLFAATGSFALLFVLAALLSLLYMKL